MKNVAKHIVRTLANKKKFIKMHQWGRGVNYCGIEAGINKLIWCGIALKIISKRKLLI